MQCSGYLLAWYQSRLYHRRHQAKTNRALKPDALELNVMCCFNARRQMKRFRLKFKMSNQVPVSAVVLALSQLDTATGNA